MPNTLNTIIAANHSLVDAGTAVSDEGIHAPDLMAAPPAIRSLGLWWIRRDLRTADNEALTAACRQSDALLPVFCFDPREVQPRREAPEGLGVPKLGPHRCRFLLEGLVELRRELTRTETQGAPGAATSTATSVEGQQQQQGCAAAAAAGAPTVSGEGPGAGPDGGAAGAEGSGAGTAAAAAAADCCGGEGEGGGGGGSGGGGGGLVVRFGVPEEVLPGLLELVAARNPQLRHVSLHHHHHLDPDPRAASGGAEVERAVQAGLRSRAARLGLSISIHAYWDRTLYHPDDLPYHLYGKTANGGTAPQRQQQPRGTAAGGGGSQPSPSSAAAAAACPPQLNLDRSRFRTLPPVMTDFRKATQSSAAIRTSLLAPTALPPLPPPFSAAAAPAASAAATSVAPASGSVASTHTTSAVATATATAAAVGNVGGGLGGIPGAVGEVYDAAPGGRAALQRLEELVGVRYDDELVPPVEQDGSPAAADPRTAFPFRAGQGSAARRLRYYVWGHQEGPQGGQAQGAQSEGSVGAASSPPSLLYFTNTRAQAVGVDSSTKLSPFVALGCITPRQIHEEVERVRAAAAAAAAATSVVADGGPDTGSGACGPPGGCSPGPVSGSRSGSGCAPPPAECDWLAMHLCIRDFFIFTVLKEGDAVLDERGIMGRPVTWRRDRDALARWARGATGLPFVDASMRELAVSGWMSNRSRQNVASLLTKDLGLDWRWGAELFESLLLDCDVAVNYCNWNYFAGVGNDPRNRHFKTVTQGIKYDEDAVLAATWLPELAHLPPALRHQPWAMTEAEAEQYGVLLGRHYPAPMVDPAGHVGQLTGTGKRKTKAAKAPRGS